jgi:hypothetical protein
LSVTLSGLAAPHGGERQDEIAVLRERHGFIALVEHPIAVRVEVSEGQIAMIDHVTLQNEPIGILEVRDSVLTIANAVQKGVHTTATKQHVVAKTTDQDIISRPPRSVSLPAPPISRTLPAPPEILSSPEPPISMSSPDLPLIGAGDEGDELGDTRVIKTTPLQS